MCTHVSISQEICDNGIDDDADGLVDLNDTIDCICEQEVFPQFIIPNPTFEISNCCPFFGEVNCVDNWEQAGNATTDYYNGCSSSLLTYNIPPIPGSDGYIGFVNVEGWNEYIGTCLNSPFLAGVQYTINFYVAGNTVGSTIDYSIFGTPDCSDLPWGTFNCPTWPAQNGQWQLLGSQSVTFAAANTWQQINITFTPSVDIEAIALGGGCQSVQIDPNEYFYLDNITLDSTIAGSFLTTGSWCGNDLMFMLDSASSVDAINFQWYLDGVALVGEVDNILDPMLYGYGDYTLMYYEGTECFRINQTLESPEYPTAEFNTAIGEVCLGDQIVLLNDTTASGIPITNWEWNMGDNSGLSTAFNQFYSYANSGVYDVELVVFSDDGCSDTVVNSVIIHDVPDAIFEFTVNGTTYQPSNGDIINICVNDSIYFDNQSSISSLDSISQYDWDLGDGNTSTDVHPAHQYTVPGAKIVSLDIGSNFNCIDDFYCIINVADVPVADFTMTASECQNIPISFSDNSTINSGSIIDYSWDFGDLSTSSLVNPVYQYSTSGIHDVSLIIESDLGCIDSITYPIELLPVPTANFEAIGHCLNEVINFNDQSIISSGNIISWNWDFGDNNTATVQSPSNIFANEGSYLVELIVESDLNCFDTFSINHVIYPIPEALFAVEDDCANEMIEFDNLSTIVQGSIQETNWSFGNGDSSYVYQPVSFSYTLPGVYPVVLEVISDQDCINYDSADLTIFELPVADIIQDPLVGCHPFNVLLNNSIDANTVECFWNLGDGNISYDCGKVIHTYFPGIYDVSLIVYSEHGCTDSIELIDFIEVFESPVADFDYTPKETTTFNTEVSFTNQSSNAYSYLWSFDNEEIVVENPVHLFPDIAGAYSVTLKAFNDAHTCEDEITKTIIIRDELTFYVPNAFTPDGNNSNEIFKPVISGIDIYAYKLTIYNRWGEVIFISYDPSVGWDGTYNSTDIVQNGVYIWQIDYEVGTKDERLTKNGIVNVIR